MENKVFKFVGYNKIPGFNVNHQGGVSVNFLDNQIIITTMFIRKRKFLISELKEVLYGITSLNIPFVALKFGSNGKKSIHLFTPKVSIFNPDPNALDDFLKFTKNIAPTKRIDDKIITGNSLKKYLVWTQYLKKKS